MTKPDALIFADDRPTSCDDDLYQWAVDAEALIRKLHAENEKLQQYKEAYDVWQDKTEWVQRTAKPNELGKHRADVLRERI